MSLKIYMDRLRFIDSLIRRRATGNVKSLSQKLSLSRSRTMEFLNEMRTYGFPIKYSRKLNSYYYVEEGALTNDLFIKKMHEADAGMHKLVNNNELRKVSGGKTFFSFFPKSDYTGLKDLNFV